MCRDLAIKFRSGMSNSLLSTMSNISVVVVKGSFIIDEITFFTYILLLA